MEKNQYAKASHSVDVAICRIYQDQLEVLLIKRNNEPFKNKHALLGGLVDVQNEESLMGAAKRELLNKANLKVSQLHQLGTYGDDPQRDPRERVISTVFYGMLSEEKWKKLKLDEDEDATEVEWLPIRKIRQLAFDHKIILKDLEKEILFQTLYGQLAFSLVPKKFTWSQLRHVYEVILEKKLIAQNFPRDIKKDFEVVELAETISMGRGKPARLIQFKKAQKKF